MMPFLKGVIMSSVISNVTRFARDVYSSNDLLGDSLVIPSKYAHYHIWKDLSQGSTGDKAIACISDIFAQTALLPCTATGCLVKVVVGIPLLYYINSQNTYLFHETIKTSGNKQVTYERVF